MSDLGLNEHHHQQAVNFIRFCRYKRNQRLKGVEHCFQDVKDSRLYEDTYTVDEVTDMLNGLLGVVRGEMEEELLNSSHTSVLLLRQLLSQAEKWHLKLSADISELENRELLEQIADFEERELSLSGGNTTIDFSKQKLQPLNESGGAALLNMEIQRLREENEKLKERSKSLEGHVTTCMKDNTLLQQQVKQLGAQPVATVDAQALKDLNEKMSNLKTELNANLDKKSGENANLSNDLTSAKHDLLRVQEQLEMTEKELDKKFQQTAAFRNLKDMLSKKNDQLKELRKRIGKYETTD